VIRAILLRLPYPNRETIRLIALHLKKVAEFSDVNKMTPRNIELTWSLSVGAVVGAVMRVLVEIESPPPSSILFGIPFLESCRNTEVAESIGPFLVPAPISRAWEWFRTHQSWGDDLFSKFSSSELPRKMRVDFNAGNHVISDSATPHDVATFVRDFIVEMPDSIFSDKLHDSFGSIADIQSPDEQVKRLRELFSQLHPAHRHTLKALTLFLSDILAHSTKMSSFSIAFAFEDRYVDKIPLLLDNAPELFGQENDVTQLPWFDLSKTSAPAAVPMISFSVSSESLAANPHPVPDLESDSSRTKKSQKSQKRSRHAVDSPSEPKSSSKKSGKLKRVKSEAELGEGRIRSPKTKGSSSETPPEKKKRSHAKMKSEDVRSARIDSGKKKHSDDDRHESPSASAKRGPKRRAGSDTPKNHGPTPSDDTTPLSSQTSTSLTISAIEDADAAIDAADNLAISLGRQLEDSAKEPKPKLKPRKSKRSSDKKIPVEVLLTDGSEDEAIRSPTVKHSTRDRKKERDSENGDDQTKVRSSKKHVKTL
jgi:hypothetical protein